MSDDISDELGLETIVEGCSRISVNAYEVSYSVKVVLHKETYLNGTRSYPR